MAKMVNVAENEGFSIEILDENFFKLKQILGLVFPLLLKVICDTWDHFIWNN